MRAPDSADSDGAVVALMDTGSYPTAAGHPFGAVGPDDLAGQGLLEAQRMAEFVVGPWEVDAAIRARPDILNTSVTGPVPTAEPLAHNQVLPDPLPALAAAHNFIAGFSTPAGLTQRGRPIPRPAERGAALRQSGGRSGGSHRDGRQDPAPAGRATGHPDPAGRVPGGNRQGL
jgi:hypothetical protein